MSSDRKNDYLNIPSNNLGEGKSGTSSTSSNFADKSISSSTVSSSRNTPREMSNTPGNSKSNTPLDRNFQSNSLYTGLMTPNAALAQDFASVSGSQSAFAKPDRQQSQKDQILFQPFAESKISEPTSSNTAFKNPPQVAGDIKSKSNINSGSFLPENNLQNLEPQVPNINSLGTGFRQAFRANETVLNNNLQSSQLPIQQDNTYSFGNPASPEPIIGINNHPQKMNFVTPTIPSFNNLENGTSYHPSMNTAQPLQKGFVEPIVQISDGNAVNFLLNDKQGIADVLQIEGNLEKQGLLYNNTTPIPNNNLQNPHVITQDPVSYLDNFTYANDIYGYGSNEINSFQGKFNNGSGMGDNTADSQFDQVWNNNDPDVWTTHSNAVLEQEFAMSEAWSHAWAETTRMNSELLKKKKSSQSLSSSTSDTSDTNGNQDGDQESKIKNRNAGSSNLHSPD
ncbi:hypothetical protein BB560_002960, partial [Smittium megazygosporum]